MILTLRNTSFVLVSGISLTDTIKSDGNIPVRKLKTEGHRMFIAPPPCTRAIAASCPRWEYKPSCIINTTEQLLVMDTHNHTCILPNIIKYTVVTMKHYNANPQHTELSENAIKNPIIPHCQRINEDVAASVVTDKHTHTQTSYDTPHVFAEG